MIEDTQEWQNIYYYTTLAMYYCMDNNNNNMVYANVLSFDNSITSLITYHMLSMELKSMISLEVYMRQKITLANYKENVCTTGRIDLFSTHHISFMCLLYIAALMCWLYVWLTYFVCMLRMHVDLSVIKCIDLQYTLVLCSSSYL